MNITEKEKIYLAVGGAALILAAVYLYVFTPIYDGYLETKAEIPLKTELLTRYQVLWKKRAAVEEKLKKAQKKYQDLEKIFLQGKTQSLAAAELQKIVEQLARQSSLEVSSSKVMGSKTISAFEKISLQLGAKCSLKDLKKFLFLVGSGKKYLNIDEIDVRAINTKGLEKLEARIQVSGYMKSHSPT